MTMFCFQCEQAAGGVGCNKHQGVCGKPSDVADLQDEMTGALVALAKTVRKNGRTDLTDQLMLDGLFTAVTNVNFDSAEVKKVTDAILSEVKEEALFDMKKIWEDQEDVRSLKSLVLFGLRGMAAYAYHAKVLGKTDEILMGFFSEAMAALAEEKTVEEWLELIMETGQMNLKCMELLDHANTGAYGSPVPTEVSTIVEKGPFIVVSGHDLHDLKLLLEQTKGKGIHIYTHSEMLPAHAYPALKQYTHLKGNFGTAWQNQQSEFENVPGAFLFTTNCLMPPKESYADRVFTTALVAYPEMVHIGDNKDFSPVIEKALELGGYQKDHMMTGINGGTVLTTGFGHAAVLGAAEQVVNAVKEGEISHFFLVGGCDGAKPGRNYYTDFVKQAPKDSMILTLACGKYRFNDLDLGTIAGLPRIMDMGQCNDAYSAIKVAVALAEAFDCEINELPLTLVLSWYEQKAVAILLTLLSLGMKNIYLGPSLPAFVSPAVLDVLVKQFQLTPVSAPEQDLKAILQE